MSTLSNVPADRIQVEAAAIYKLIRENRPELQLGPLDLSGESSPAIGGFWREIGWCKEFARMIAPPGPENAKLLDVAVEAYRHWGPPDRLPPLPGRFRLVEPDMDGVGFAITDESADPVDPPVVRLSAEDLTAEKEGESYLRWAAWGLVKLALRPWYRPLLESEPTPEDLATGQPLPHLLPGARTFGDDLWLAPSVGDASHPGGELAIRRFEALATWLTTEKRLQKLYLSALPGDRYRLAAGVDFAAAAGGWRRIEGTRPGLAYLSGELEGIPVLVQLGRQPELAASPTDKARITAALQRRGWI